MTAQTINNITFYRTTNDVNGNPRYLVHFLDFLKDDDRNGDVLKDFQIAKARAKKCGFREFRGKIFGGGFIISSYNLYDVANRINETLKSC